MSQCGGFILGGAVAYSLRVGFVLLRHPGELFNAAYAVSYADYTGQEKVLGIHVDAVQPGQRVLIVDDWLETGSTMRAAIQLIERCSGQVAGIAVLMDDMDEPVRQDLVSWGFHALLRPEPHDRF